MAKVTGSECVGCSTVGLPCRYNACPNYMVTRYYCDKCKEEFSPDELYVTPDGEFCDKCILNEFDTVAQVEERG